MIMMILLGVWHFYLRPPGDPKIYPDDYAKNVFDVGSKLYDNIIIPIILIGWLSVVIKLVGWKTVAEWFDGFISVFKKKDK